MFFRLWCFEKPSVDEKTQKQISAPRFEPPLFLFFGFGSLVFEIILLQFVLSLFSSFDDFGFPVMVPANCVEWLCCFAFFMSWIDNGYGLGGFMFVLIDVLLLLLLLSGLLCVWVSPCRRVSPC